MIGVLALPAVMFALAPFHASSEPLPQPVRAQLKTEGFWRASCPVGLAGLRLLTVSHWGFDGRAHTGQLVVNARAAGPLARAFRKLYGLHFPIRHLQLADMYGPTRDRPRDDDVSGSFECRQAVPSPCTGGRGTGTWSMHAYGLAVDVNPVENPYVGCGQSRDPSAKRVLRPLAPPPRDGDAAGDRGVPVDRLGLGRLVDRRHEGLHALLIQRALIAAR